MKIFFLLLVQFIPLVAQAAASEPSYPVSHLQLELREKRVLEVAPKKIKTAISSQDNIVQIIGTAEALQIEASGFGVATLTVYFEDESVALYRVTVPTHGIQMSHSDLISAPLGIGSYGSIGTGLGFRSRHGLFEDLVQQEEFLNYRLKSLDSSQELRLRSVKPIFYGAPKDARMIEEISVTREEKNIYLGLGDLDPLSIRSRGSVRGLRMDYLGKAFNPFLFGGFARTGVRNFLIGSEPTALWGGGLRARPLPELSVLAYGLGFKRNLGLGLLQDGIETGLGIHWNYGKLRDLGFDFNADKNFKISYSGSLLLDLNPLSISGFGSRTPSGLEIYTQASRYASQFDSYGGSLNFEPSDSFIKSGVSFAKNLQFSQLDGVSGKSELKSVSAETQFNFKKFQSALNGTVYETQFTAFDVGPLFSHSSEKGQRLDFTNQLDWTEGIQLTLGFSAGNIESKLLAAHYENQELSLGVKQLLVKSKSDYLHFELGFSRLRQISTDETGKYLLARVSGAAKIPFLQVDGILQNEYRISGMGESNYLRAQIGTTYLFNPNHELALKAYHQFEWQRRIYSDNRGLFFQYVMHFGSLVPSSSIFSNLQRYQISGKVSQDARSVAQVIVRLVGLDEVDNRETQTDREGDFSFEGLKPQSYSVTVAPRGELERIRLKSLNPQTIKVVDGNVKDVNFTFTESAVLQGICYHDVNGNLKPDSTEQALEGVNIRFRKRGTQAWKLGFENNGQYQIEELSPGIWEFIPELNSLPAGFRTDIGIRMIEIKPNAMENLNFPLLAERSVSGIVFKDLNQNRIKDKGESGLDYLSVELLGRTTRTGDGGHFLFRHLPIGSGKVRSGKWESEKLQLLEEPTQLMNVFVPVGD